jgi:hypothetical protein
MTTTQAGMMVAFAHFLAQLKITSTHNLASEIP